MLGQVNYLNLLIYGYIRLRLTLVEMTLALTMILYPVDAVTVEIVIMNVKVFTVEKYVMMDVDAVTVDAVEIVIMKASMHLGLI